MFDGEEGYGFADDEDREFDMPIDNEADFLDEEDELFGNEEAERQAVVDYELELCAEEDAEEEASEEARIKKAQKAATVKGDLKSNDDAERAFQKLYTQIKRELKFEKSKEKKAEIKERLAQLDEARNDVQLQISGLGPRTKCGKPRVRKLKDAQVENIDYVVNTATFIPKYDDNRVKELRQLCPIEFWEDVIDDLKLEHTRKQFDVKKLEREYKANKPEPVDGLIDIDWTNDSCINLMLENIDNIVTDDLELIYRPGADCWIADTKRTWRDWEYYMTPQWNWIFWVHFSRFVGNSYRWYSNYFVRYARGRTEKLPRNGKKYDRHQHFFFMLKNVRLFIDYYDSLEVDDEKKSYIDSHYFKGISRKMMEELLPVKRGSINWTLDKANEDFARILINNKPYETKAATLLSGGLEKLKNLQFDDAIKQVDSEIKMVYVASLIDELVDRLERFEKWQRKEARAPKNRKKA